MPFSITPTEIQTVISFSQHSMELWGVADIATSPPLPFLIALLPILFIWLPLPLSFAVASLHKNEIKVSCFLPQSLLCKLWDFQSELKYHTVALSLFISFFFPLFVFNLTSSYLGLKPHWRGLGGGLPFYVTQTAFLNLFASVRLRIWNCMNRCMNGNESEIEQQTLRQKNVWSPNSDRCFTEHTGRGE